MFLFLGKEGGGLGREGRGEGRRKKRKERKERKEGEMKEKYISELSNVEETSDISVWWFVVLVWFGLVWFNVNIIHFLKFLHFSY